jgi:periplasmic protein TonB
MTVACQSTGIRAEICSDIFTAIEKAKTRAFSCIIADWAEQPEASFLLKRARESSSNHDTVAVAIVDNEPTTAEVRDNRLDYLIYRPISAEEAEAVLAKAGHQMKSSGAEDPADAGDSNHPLNDTAADNSADSRNSNAAQEIRHDPVDGHEESSDGGGDSESASGVYEGDESRELRGGIGLRGMCAAGLTLIALFCLWNSRDSIDYLLRTKEGSVRVLRESVAALFYMNQSGALPVGTAGSDAQQDAYFSRVPAGSTAPALAVAATASTLNELPVSVRSAPDFPLQVPVIDHPPTPPVHVARAAIPESMRNSPAITPPVVVTVSPAQMMPISSPQPQAAIQQISEPVAISEEAARTMLLHSVEPIYPPEGLAQKLHGPVVLQAVIGRDGGVEDLKFVRGYFILGRAAIAAVKQWRFQPYVLNGRPAATQTVITVNFAAPTG